jgi:hypothetical protein
MERKICDAIRGRRLVAFSLGGRHRIAEPHDYGAIDGRRRLFFYQVGGASLSGAPIGWRWGELDKLAGLRLLDGNFEGARPVPSGRHRRWDRLIASVSRTPDG